MSTEARVSHNVIANFAGRLWTAGMALAFVPVYIRLLGPEKYGLVGFFISLQMILSLLEMGLGTTATKELARLSSSTDHRTAQQMRNLVRTLELLYFGLAILAATIVLVSSKPLAAHWFNPDALSRKEIQYVIVVMGLVIAARMPFALYSGALIGLQRQVTLNVILVITVTVKNLGAVAALLVISKDVLVFFLWNLIAELVQTALTCYVLQKKLPKSSEKARFQLEQIKNIWRFAAGMTGVVITNVALSQADKLFVSKMFSLETFGYYSAMWTIAGGIFFLTYPITTAAFPRYAQLWETHDKEKFASFYHKTCRLLATIMLPVGICVLFFSREVLAIWLGAPDQAEALENVLRILVMGTILNSLFNLPMNLQFATGRTSLVFYTNFSWLICFPLAMWWLTSLTGLSGAPIAWLIYNLFGFTFVAYMAHKTLLREALFQWYVKDIGIPLVVGGTIIGGLFLMLPMPTGTVGQCLVLGTCATMGAAGSLLTLKSVRSRLAQKLSVWIT
jgi:O-antigen/teichoic acid export membrane protein